MAARRLPRRGVVADPDEDPFGGDAGEAFPDRGDELVFGHAAPFRTRVRRSSGYRSAIGLEEV
jgi:hypothetical protein